MILKCVAFVAVEIEIEISLVGSIGDLISNTRY